MPPSLTAIAREQAAAIPVMPWREFWPMFCARYDAEFSRENAEHVTIMGPPGAGKSSLAMHVAGRRQYVVQLVEKPRDKKLLAALKRAHYYPAKELPDVGGRQRVYVWPPAGLVKQQPGQRDAFRAVLETAGRVGVWHTVVHETPYLVDPLGLAPELKQNLRLSRSNGAGLILCAQRPAWLPRDMYSACSHLFLFSTNDSVDLKALGGLNGMNERVVREAVSNLPRDHRFLYVGTKDGTLAISRAPKGL